MKQFQYYLWCILITFLFVMCLLPSDQDEDSDDEDDGGWITPSNIKEIKASMGDKNLEKANVTVGCITGDFAMQASDTCPFHF